MITFPQAKINVGLRILRRRADGYHDIESIFYPVGLCDALEYIVVPNAKADELVVSGCEIPDSYGDNLIIKAVKIFRQRHHLPYLKIHLHKAIPCGGGLGGGSSDGSFILRSINKWLDYNLSSDDLREMAIEIGSDCPFFVDSLPSLVSGRGELLTPVAPFLKGMYIVLLHPHINISTKEAYLHCQPKEQSRSLNELIKVDPSEWKKVIVNDFEKYAFKKYPLLDELKKTLYHSGAIFSSMSGSGSALYGIFDNNRPPLPQNLVRYIIYQGEL